MKSFTTYLTESKNLHMEHLEDLIFNEGESGVKQIFKFLESSKDLLAGNSKQKISATTKYDGSPSVFVGVDPADGKFFVAKKGLFSKTPKMYKTQGDIDKELSGDLAAKFTIALREFKKLGIKKGVYQGDLMFTKSDIKTETIDGERYYTFQPNTIVYAVPTNSNLGKQIRSASIGVVWHTTYEGDSIQNMQASFGKDIVSKFNKTKTIWMDDATYKDVSGTASFTAAETTQFNDLINQAKAIITKLPKSALNAIASDSELLMRVKTYNNTKIRAGQKVINTTTHVAGLIKYLGDYYKSEEDKRKTQKGKDAIKEKMMTVFKPLRETPLVQLKLIFDFMNIVVEAKQMIINKMNTTSTLNTFLRTKSGLTVTSPEGFVAIDHLTGGAIKLVDRLEFSRANFSPEIIKGWVK